MTLPKLSGNNYVAAFLAGEPHRIKTAVESRCNHRDTICADCAPTWSDYDLRLKNTAAGRAIAAKLNIA